MSDMPDPCAGPPADTPAQAQVPARPETAPPEGDDRYPWNAQPAPDGAADSAGRRERHDAFTEGRKRAFLTALVKSGCILDACRSAGISAQTFYRHQAEDARFAGHVREALAIAATPLELVAWRRAVVGVEQEFACGGQVHVRRRYSDGLLRLLLQGSNPKKYGPNPGFSRKRLLKHEKKAMRREIRAELEETLRPRELEQVKQSILRKLSAIERHREPERRAAGWTMSAEGHWVPPGYAWVGLPEGVAPPGGTGADGLVSRAGEDGPAPTAPGDRV